MTHRVQEKRSPKTSPIDSEYIRLHNKQTFHCLQHSIAIQIPGLYTALVACESLHICEQFTNGPFRWLEAESVHRHIVDI